MFEVSRGRHDRRQGLNAAGSDVDYREVGRYPQIGGVDATVARVIWKYANGRGLAMRRKTNVSRNRGERVELQRNWRTERQWQLMGERQIRSGEVRSWGRWVPLRCEGSGWHGSTHTIQR